ncbi:MAG: radical SAM protein [Fibrobacterota bacterium]
MSTKPSIRRTISMDWFINSECDWSCIRCKPPSIKEPKQDLNLDHCFEALHSFVELGKKLDRDAIITFYPRQAPFTEPFISILKIANELKAKGLITSIRSANRGDLPEDKVLFFQENGVDVCQLTFDGPKPVQDFLRRENSFRDTIKAFRNVRKQGIHVTVLLIVIHYKIPHLGATLRFLLDEGFDDFILQAGICPEPGRYPAIASKTKLKGAENPWEQQLTVKEYRALLLGTLQLLDSLPERFLDVRNDFILKNQMFARLFDELGRGSEYDALRKNTPVQPAGIKFQLRPNGDLLWHSHQPKLASFPGASFLNVYDKSPILQLLDTPSDALAYMSENQKEFAKCLSCPAAKHCLPVIIGASGDRPYFYPDEHCWIS